MALTAQPLAAVRDALERHDCDPRGPEHRFTARCPAHDDRDPSLSVSVGADGRALVYCHAGCQAEAVVGALGLAWGDLFPPGHRHARPLPGIARPRRALDLVLEALREVGIDYRATRSPTMWVAERCPACGAAERWPLWMLEHELEGDRGRSNARVTLSCFGGCEQVDVLAALAGIAEGGS